MVPAAFKLAVLLQVDRILPAYSSPCGPIALQHGDDPAVGKYLIEELLQACGQSWHVQAAILRQQLVQPQVVADPVDPVRESGKDLLLAGEVVIEGGLVDPYSLSDLAHRCSVESVVGEELKGCLQDPVPRDLTSTCAFRTHTGILLDGG
jgi:hypothetical protein